MSTGVAETTRSCRDAANCPRPRSRACRKDRRGIASAVGCSPSKAWTACGQICPSLGKTPVSATALRVTTTAPAAAGSTESATASNDAGDSEYHAAARQFSRGPCMHSTTWDFGRSGRRDMAKVCETLVQKNPTRSECRSGGSGTPVPSRYLRWCRGAGTHTAWTGLDIGARLGRRSAGTRASDRFCTPDRATCRVMSFAAVMAVR